MAIVILKINNFSVLIKENTLNNIKEYYYDILYYTIYLKVFTSIIQIYINK